MYANLFNVSPECRLWLCRWLTGDDTMDLERPDRSRVVIDQMPDFIRAGHGVADQTVEVVQYWVDPKEPDAWRSPSIRAFMVRRAEEGKAALIRYDNQRGLVVFPPPLTGGRGWIEHASALNSKEHTALEVMRALGGGHG